MTDKEILKLAEEHNTPFYVFDTEMLSERMKSVRRIVGDNIRLCYSIKANPFLIPAMLELTDALEVCSPGELEICMELKVPPEKIIYSGVMKTAENVEAAAGYGVKIFTAESKKHVRLINAQGIKDGTRYTLLPRLNAGSQFGMSKEDLLEVVGEADSLEGVEIAGIHYFVGTGRGKLKQQEKELGELLELFEELRDGGSPEGEPSGEEGDIAGEEGDIPGEEGDIAKLCKPGKVGYELCKLEYGPGLPVPYFEGEDFSDTLKPLKDLAETLKTVAGKVELTIEMGRFFASECGYYVTRVMDIKSAHGTNYCVIDGGINHISYYGQIMGMKVPVIKHFRAGSGGSEDNKKYAIAGSLCTTADIPVREIEFKGLSEGDILVFCNIGAYSVTEGMYLFLSRNMPEVFLYGEGGRTALVRRGLHTSAFNTIT